MLLSFFHGEGDCVTWLVFTYSLPAAERSSPRVAIWRKLTRMGAISPRGGVHILPSREECLESFQWLGKEVQQHGGESLLMRVESFEGMTNADVIGLFQEKSDKDYKQLEDAVANLEKAVSKKQSSEIRLKHYSDLQKVRKAQQEILKTDFFNSPAGARIVSRFAKLDRLLSESGGALAEIPRVSPADFQNKIWVTRPRPHVDRLASAWLIRRFIDSRAEIRYAKVPQEGEIGFDMKEGGTFGHVGKFCTFETFLTAFNLQEEGLWRLAEVVHEIDFRDGAFMHAEISGIDLILKGWLLSGFTDQALELHGIALFEGLFQALQKERSATDPRKRK
jgi:hypothetical protein